MEQLAYFTLKDRRDMERVTVCIAQFGEKVVYGIAMCSDSDKWKTGRGRSLALKRAKKAAFEPESILDERNFIQRREGSKVMHDLTFDNFERLTLLLSESGSSWWSKYEELPITYNEAVSIMVVGLW